MRLGSEGELLWQGVVDLTGTGEELVQRVLSLSDGSLLLGGETGGAFVTRVNVAAGTVAERHDDHEPFRSDVYPMTAYETVHFELEINRHAQVSATIYDVTGRIVRTIPGVGSLGAGVHAISWNGTDDAGRRLPSGVYLAPYRDIGRIPDQNGGSRSLRYLDHQAGSMACIGSSPAAASGKAVRIER